MSRASAIQAAVLSVVSLIAVAPAVQAEPKKPASEENGKYFDAEGNPTYNVKPDGTVDWYTYSGFRRYHSECHVCHGPDGMGSTYAPALIESVERLSYQDFIAVIIQGRENVTTGSQSVMPSFGTNKNVVCYLDDIYVYLRARGDGAIGRGRPMKREDKPQAATDAEKACLGE